MNRAKFDVCTSNCSEELRQTQRQNCALNVRISLATMPNSTCRNSSRVQPKKVLR